MRFLVFALALSLVLPALSQDPSAPHFFGAMFLMGIVAAVLLAIPSKARQQ